MQQLACARVHGVSVYPVTNRASNASQARSRLYSEVDSKEAPMAVLTGALLKSAQLGLVHCHARAARFLWKQNKPRQGCSGNNEKGMATDLARPRTSSTERFSSLVYEEKKKE